MFMSSTVSERSGLIQWDPMRVWAAVHWQLRETVISPALIYVACRLNLWCTYSVAILAKQTL